MGFSRFSGKAFGFRALGFKGECWRVRPPSFYNIPVVISSVQRFSGVWGGLLSNIADWRKTGLWFRLCVLCSGLRLVAEFVLLAWRRVFLHSRQEVALRNCRV